MAAPIPIGNNFLDLPKPHHHASRLIVLAVIMAIIVLVIWLYATLMAPRMNTQPVNQTPVAAVPTPLSADYVSIISNLRSSPAPNLPAKSMTAIKSQLSKTKPTLSATQITTIMGQLQKQP